MAYARGQVYNPTRNSQLKDYSGLRWDKITPTDLDGVVDYKGRLWLLYEYKYGNAPLPFGQRLAFERLCADLSKARPTLGIIARHMQPIDEAIDCANAEVAEIWQGGRWVISSAGYTVKKLSDAFIEKYGAGLAVPVAFEPIEIDLDVRKGLRCGIGRQMCRWCVGAPCVGSTQWEES